VQHNMLKSGGPTAIKSSSPSSFGSRSPENCSGMGTTGFLVEIQSANLDNLQRKSPDAFNQPHNLPSSIVMKQVFYKGYLKKAIEAVCTKKDINLGDPGLHKIS
jgi:hypothetical protein